MTSRETAWKSRAPAGFEERVAQAMTRRMYLVQECGPTSFVVKEAEETQQNEEGGDAGMVLGTRSRRRQEQKKFKVQLGGRMSCSCRSKEELPCFHLLFVLLKLLRVPPENPFLWQDSLLDSEVEQILRGRFNVVQDRKKRESPAEASAEVEQKPIVEGDVCVICQEELSSEKEPLTYCRRSCGNSVHARCMKVWGEHKTSQKENISCPLCREDWGPDALALLSRDLRPPRRPSNLHHGVCCSRCRSLPVVGTRYRCLLCQDLDLCSSCFAHDSHRHHPFVQKELRDSPWAPANRQANRRGDGGEGRLQQQLMQQLQSRELTEDDYEVLLQLDSSSGLVSLHEHLVLSLPHPSRDQVAQAGERGSTSCVFCSHAINNGSELRRLTCSCLAHQLCLQSQLILDPSLCCPSCSLPLFPGLAPGGARDQSRTRRRRVSDKQTSKAGQAQEEEAAELSFAVTGKCLSGGNVEMMASNQHAGMEGGGEGGGGGAAAAAASSSAAAALPPHPHGRSSLALTMQRLRKGTRSAPVLGGSTRTSSLEAREGGGSIVTHGRSLGRSNGGDEEALAYSCILPPALLSCSLLLTLLCSCCYRLLLSCRSPGCPNVGASSLSSSSLTR
mmetsp:Transcript_18627/g.61188  ORF Transcript_18627/g.61188 Transcript_18627/m.61188 type:complete len:616 (-) Transcript_18627:259-2106(-)